MLLKRAVIFQSCHRKRKFVAHNGGIRFNVTNRNFDVELRQWLLDSSCVGLNVIARLWIHQQTVESPWEVDRVGIGEGAVFP